MRKVLLIGSCWLIVFLLAGGGMAQEKPQYGGIFRWPSASDPPTLDPAHVVDTTSDRVARFMFNGLVDMDLKTFKPIPSLAEKWAISRDGKVYTFYLRKGVKFHPPVNREVTAEDFKYTFERFLNPKTRSENTWILEDIKGAPALIEGKTETLEGVKVIDRYTLQITLERPFAPFLSKIVLSNTFVVPWEEAEKWGDAFTEHPCGTGPFKFVEWIHDVHVKLIRFDDYFKGKPYLEGIEFRIIPEEATRLAEFQAGNLEVVDIPFGMIKFLQADPKWKDMVVIYPMLGIYYVGFNMEKEPFKNNKKLRQAFNYAVDRKGICEVIREGAAIPAKGFSPPSLPGFDPTIEGYTYNPEKARQLLAEAGYPGGKGLPSITYWHNAPSKTHSAIAQYIQANLRDIGVNVDINTMDWAAYLQFCQEGKPQMFRMGWVADYADPDDFLWVNFHSANIGPRGNYSRYSNPRVDALLSLAQEITDWDQRVKLYSEAERILIEDAPVIFVYWYVATGMLQPYVKNFEFCHFDGQPEFAHTPVEKVWLAKK